MDIIAEDLNGSTWIAAVENRKIWGLEVDPINEIVRWGSIYLAKVTRIDSKLNAAFLDLGYDQSGIIYASDVLLPDNTRPPKSKKIGQLLRSGQIIPVQVKHARNPQPEVSNDLPLMEKASKVSMDISLSGRYMIFTPLSEGNRLSKRITNKTVRKNMGDMLKSIDSISGCILRASAANCQTEVLVREGRVLNAIWDSLQDYLNTDETEPSLIMMGPDASQRILANHATDEIGRIAVSTLEQFEDIEDWCELYAPDLVTKIDPSREGETVVQLGLFETYGIVEDIDTLFQPYVLLNSGGNIIIQETAALTAIDINQGSDKTPLNTNLEAAKEIARQIRIRNLGGVILIDFINMKQKKQRDQVLAHLSEEIAKDSCTVDVLGWTKSGLIEITRARRTPPLKERFIQSDIAPYDD